MRRLSMDRTPVRAFVPLIIACLAGIGLASSAAAQIFPTFAGDAQRSGQSPYAGPESGDRLHGHGVLQAAGATTSPVVGFDGSIYVGSPSGLIAFSRRGAHRWTFPQAATSGATVAFDGTIYYQSQDTLYALHPNGQFKWQAPALGGSQAPMIGDDGDLWVPSTASRIFRIRDDGTTGTLQATCFTSGPVRAPLAMDADGRLVAGVETPRGGMIEVFEQSCSRVWYAPAGGSTVLAAPTVMANGDVLAVSTSATSTYLSRFSATDGSLMTSTSFSVGDHEGSATLSRDGLRVYLTVDDDLLALSALSLGKLWQKPASGSLFWGSGIESTPLVDADDFVYVATQSSLASFDSVGNVRWSAPAGDTYPEGASPALGAHGELVIAGSGAAMGQAMLHRFEKEKRWPSSDQTMDMAASIALSYTDDIYDNMSDMALVTNMPTPNLLKVEEVDGEYKLWMHNYWNQGGKEYDLDPDRLDYILNFNPDFLSYTDDPADGDTYNGLDPVQQAQHHQRFAHFWNSQNPHRPLGSYMSSTTCIDSPQRPDNLDDTGNSYPATVMDCCDITGATTDCRWSSSAPYMVDEDDGRYFLPFDSPTDVANAMDHVRRTVREQHLTHHIFLDNGRYYTGHNTDAVLCWRCYKNCAGDSDCEARCWNGIADPGESSVCEDRRQDPTHTYSLTPPWPQQVHANDMVDYLGLLVSTLNDEGFLGLLNLSAKPYTLGEPIEAFQFQKFLDAMGPGNGIAFEQEWYWYARAVPRMAEQEMDVYRRLLAQDMLVLQYPHYDDPGQQWWRAAMAIGLREPGDSLFLSRNKSETPFWADWPSRYSDAPLPMDIQGFCTGSCEANHKVRGNWLADRSFNDGEQIRVVGRYHAVDMEPTLDVQHSLSDMMAPHTGYIVVAGPDIGTVDASGNYRADFTDLEGELGSSPDPGIHKVDTYYTLGKSCTGSPVDFCEDLVAVAVQLEVEVPAPPTP